MRPRALWAACAALALAGCSSRASPPGDPPLELFEWERGLGVRATRDTSKAMFLWFYEWNLFDAFERGELTNAHFEDFEHALAPDRRSGTIRGRGVELSMRVDDKGVELALEVENRSDHDWPDTAAMIACFNAGPPETKPYELGHHLKTYFASEQGLERLPDRDMHFAVSLRGELEKLSPKLEFAFSDRWATSQRNTTEGVLLRESRTGGWTTGIAWNEYIGVQAHNPWLCMHIATKVGPLARGAKKSLRGRMYLFPGTPQQGFERYRTDFKR